MKYLISAVLLYLISPQLLLADYVEIDSTVASMEGEAITASDLQKKAGKTDVSQKDLKNFLLDEILEKEASTRGIAVKAEDIDSYISNIKKQNNINDAQFKTALEQKNMSEEVYREQIKQEILKGKTIAQLVSRDIKIVDEDIDAYLAQNPHLQPEVGTAKVNIVKSKSRSELEELRSKLLESSRSLRELQPEGFVDLGYIKLGELREDYQKALKGLVDGETSEIVKTNNGYVIIELAGRINQIGNADKDLKNHIKNLIFREKYKNAIDGVLTQDLLDKHELKIIRR